VKSYKVPIEKPKPDITRFLRIMEGSEIPDRAPMVEYLVDNALMKPILRDLLGCQWVDTSEKTEYMGGQMDFSREARETIGKWLDNQIAFWYHMGYDFTRVEVSLPLPAVSLVTQDTARGNERSTRAWQGLHSGPIGSWESFEAYPWPEVSDRDFFIHEYICNHLSDGLGFFSCHAGGVYEHVSRLMGYEGLCMSLYDNPGLVKAVADKVGELIYRYNEHLVQFDELAAIFQKDDFGFNTQTLLPPEVLREYFIPWHKKFAEQAHEKEKHYYLHSCGKVDAIMEDLIEKVRIDGKHSFQDNVLPISEAKKRYGDRICLLGGIDVDKLASYDPERLRTYVRRTIDSCSSGGSFAVGAGNSIPSYIPIENYLTMIDEALR
jgi:uroporphyrinogen decarboxylase